MIFLKSIYIYRARNYSENMVSSWMNECSMAPMKVAERVREKDLKEKIIAKGHTLRILICSKDQLLVLDGFLSVWINKYHTMSFTRELHYPLFLGILL